MDATKKQLSRRKKVAYVAGPFRGPNMYETIMNIRKAEAMACELWVMGFTVICPHTNTANMEGLLPDDGFLIGDIELIKRSDFVVLYLPHDHPKIINSKGTQGEIKFCAENNVSVYDDLSVVKLYQG